MGAQFDQPQAEWPALASHFDGVVHGQASLLSPGPVLGELEQRYALRLDLKAENRQQAEAPLPRLISIRRSWCGRTSSVSSTLLRQHYATWALRKS